MTYGKVQCELFGEPAILELTDEGWRVPGEPILATTFDLLADPGDFSPADGDPMAAAVIKLAGILGGTYELTTLPALPAGTIY